MEKSEIERLTRELQMANQYNSELFGKLIKANEIIDEILNFDNIDSGSSIRCKPEERYYKIMKWVRKYRRCNHKIDEIKDKCPRCTRIDDTNGIASEILNVRYGGIDYDIRVARAVQKFLRGE